MRDASWRKAKDVRTGSEGAFFWVREHRARSRLSVGPSARRLTGLQKAVCASDWTLLHSIQVATVICSKL